MTEYFIMLIPSLILIHLFYLFAVIKKNLSVIDTAWGLGFILISLTGAKLNHFDHLKENITMLMVLLWGIRLASFIYFRNKNLGEDFRYRNWRNEWGEKTNQIAYFKVYLLQFFLMSLVALPLFAVHQSNTPQLSLLNIAGIVTWGIGLIWETVADYQKSQFKKKIENQNKVMKTGLWSLSRHPNYFGEILLWWGISITVFNIEIWWALIGPLILNLLIWKVSGVPLLEVKHADNLEYQLYKAATPTLIPRLL